jgi:probable F420-dependent oxidoreductase
LADNLSNRPVERQGDQLQGVESQSMKIGVFARVTQQSMSIRELARGLEERGIESLFVGEHTHTPVASVADGYHDAAMVENAKSVPAPFLLLAAAAAVTERLRVGTSISLIAQHDPLVYAKDVATLDMLSGGRVELGVGYGWNRAEMLNHGVDPRRRRAAFRDKLRAVEMLWSQDIAEFSGEFAAFSASWSWPKPVQGRRPKVLIGAPARADVFGDIVELADGWMPSTNFTDSELSDQIDQLRRTASEAGRSPDELSVTLLDARHSHGLGPSFGHGWAGNARRIAAASGLYAGLFRGDLGFLDRTDR